MTDRFEICQKDTATFEGVNANHPADPGGKTRFGITEATNRAYEKETGARAIPIFEIPYDRALAIYRRNYWAPLVDRYNLVPGVDRAAYDAGVNNGVSRSKKWLVLSAGSDDHSKTAAGICDRRLSFDMSLKIWKTFGKGWSRRIAFMKARSVAEALDFMAASDKHELQPAEVSKKLAESRADARDASEAAAGRRDQTTVATGGGAAATGGSEACDPNFLSTEWLIAIGIGVAIGVALIWWFNRAAQVQREIETEFAREELNRQKGAAR